jgi:hypothetical protein
MQCPYCKMEMNPRKNGKPIDPALSHKKRKEVRYQRYQCPLCFRQIKGEIITEDIPAYGDCIHYCRSCGKEYKIVGMPESMYNDIKNGVHLCSCGGIIDLEWMVI